MTDGDVIVVGLGAMGLPMARSIQAAGLRVAGIDPALIGCDEREGIDVRDTFPERLSSTVIVVMVATGAQLALVLDSVADRDLSGSTWVICSTVGPGALRREADRLRSASAGVVDAPVTGGVAGAQSGSLLLFVSGAAMDIEAASAVLNAVGRPAVVGETPGDGQVLKGVNQLLCSIHLVAAAEALAVIGGLGLDQKRALELLGQGAAASWMLRDRGPRMLESADDIRSAISIFVKDSGIAAETAAAAGVEAPLLAAARQQFLNAANQGLSHADDASIIECYTSAT